MAVREAGITPRRFPSQRHRWWQHPDNIIVALTLAFTAATAVTLHLPPKVPPLRVVNESALTVSLDVRRADVGGWMGLGTVAPGRTTVREVIDQGATWLVRVRVGSRVAPQFAVSRTKLRDQHWTLTIPESVTESLRRRGAVPEP